MRGDNLENPFGKLQDDLAKYLIDKYYLQDCMVTLQIFNDGITPPVITVSYSDLRDRVDAGMFVNDLMENFDLSIEGITKMMNQ